MAELWDDNADFIIKGLDKQIRTKYGFLLSDLLTSPSEYAQTENVLMKISNVKEEVNSNIDSILGGMPQEVKKAEDSFAKANAITERLSQTISVEAKKNNVPLITSAYLQRKEDSDEIIYVDTIDGWPESLVEKFASLSDYIADMTTMHGKHRIGSWIFSGRKQYVLNVRLESSPVLAIEDARADILSLLDDAAQTVMGLGATK